MSTRQLHRAGHRDHGIPLQTLVDRWLAAGMITADQAARLTADGDVVVDTGTARRPTAAGPPLVAEAIGYVGGAITAAGALLVAAYYWEDMSTGWRLGTLLIATLVLLGAGIAVPGRLGPAGHRMRSVLWLASAATWTGASAVFVTSVLDARGPTARVLVAAAATAFTVGVWVAHRYGLQQVAMMASAAALLTTLLDRSGLVDEPGIGVWAVGVAWVLLGRLRLLRPPEVPLVLGSALAVGGAMSTAASDAGMVLTLTTVCAVVVGGVVTRDLLLLAVGSIGALVNVPAAMSRWFPDSVLAAIGVVVTGLILVGVAVWVVRRPGDS